MKTIDFGYGDSLVIMNPTETPPEENEAPYWRFKILRSRNGRNEELHSWDQYRLLGVTDVASVLYGIISSSAVDSHIEEVEEAIKELLELYPNPPLWETPRRRTARYEIVMVDGEKIILRDLRGARSVTNEAEAVVREVIKEFDDPYLRVFYYDTLTQFAELVHDRGTFTTFHPAYERFDQ